MKYPLVSVVIATFNSNRSLEKVLLSLKKQNYPKNKIEIIIVDGGSEDGTIELAKKYKCKIFNNPNTDQVYGKFIGYKKAKGKLLLLIDSDEVIEDKNSIFNKVLALTKDTKIKVAVSTGLKKPNDYPQINYYLNEFGDPFSYFMYHDSKDPRFFINSLKRKYEKLYEDKDKIVFDFSNVKQPPFIELTAMSVMVNIDYIKKNIPEILKKPSTHTHLFYLINTQGNLFSIMKHDSVIHYSVGTIPGYLRKIRSRVTSNIFSTEMGKAGFSGREEFQKSDVKFKKYLFIIYGLSIIFPLIDSIYLVFTRRKYIYFLHVLLSFYTAFMICFYGAKKILGIKTKLYKYGGK